MFTQLITNIRLGWALDDLNQTKSVRERDNQVAKVVSFLRRAHVAATNSGLKEVVFTSVRDMRIRNVLMRELGLIKGKDIVCELSQGRFEGGQKACAAICLIAAVDYLNDRDIANEEDVYGVMTKGIQLYRAGKYTDYIDFSELLKTEPTLEPIYPEVEMEEILKESSLPIDGDDLEACITGLEKCSKGGKVAGVFTCNEETVMITFSADGAANLFDSHGRPYNRMDMGASVLSFVNKAALIDHLKTIFHAKPFQLYILKLKEEKDDN